MTKIILTRHGDVEGIKPERFRGRNLVRPRQRRSRRGSPKPGTRRRSTQAQWAAASLGGFARGDGFAATTNGRGGRRGCFGRDFCAILHRKVNAAENVSRV